MKKVLIMTYGLSEKQKEILCSEFSSEYIHDVTDCFSDLISIPAATVVVNPDMMNDNDKIAFNEVFKHDYDTCISILGPMENMDFLHVVEDDYEAMTETIGAVKRRLAIPAEFESAKLRMENVMAGITSVMEIDPDDSFNSHIGHINNTCTPYEELTRIMENIPNLKPQEKIPYRFELNSVLLAVMVAYGIVSLEDIDYVDGPKIGYEREWIESLSSDIKKHYKDMVIKNSPNQRSNVH